jgi:hypothetical protein
VKRRPFLFLWLPFDEMPGCKFLCRIPFEGRRHGGGICPPVYRHSAHMVKLRFPLYIFGKSQGKEDTKMEAIREHSLDAINVMHWEGIDFEFLEPEVKFDREWTRTNRGKQKQPLTGKQKKLMEAERFTHALP